MTKKRGAGTEKKENDYRNCGHYRYNNPHPYVGHFVYDSLGYHPLDNGHVKEGNLIMPWTVTFYNITSWARVNLQFQLHFDLCCITKWLRLICKKICNKKCVSKNILVQKIRGVQTKFGVKKKFWSKKFWPKKSQVRTGQIKLWQGK